MSYLSVPTARLEKVRSEARLAASKVLEVAGFQEKPGGQWEGSLTMPDGLPALRALVTLPPWFPDSLPEVMVDRRSLPRRVAHVERSGKVCLALPGGLLIDAERPEDIVTETLARAAAELGRGISGESDAELLDEFLAYWQGRERGNIFTLCQPCGPPRVIKLSRLEAPSGVVTEIRLLTDSTEAAQIWASNVGGKVIVEDSAFLLPLGEYFTPPDFDEEITLGSILASLRGQSGESDFELLRKWLHHTHLPALVMVLLPGRPPARVRALIAFSISALRKEAAAQVQAGFRAGRVPKARELAAAASAPVIRAGLQRVDGDFLTKRAGASASLLDRTVTVIGVGSVGSEIACNLAIAGVGTLRLIDPEDLAVENVHRHALGMVHVRSNKAISLSRELGRRLPHLHFEWRAKDVETVLMEDPHFILDSSLVVVATGNETLERRLNSILIGGPARIHAWVEPLGIGGHALACSTAPGARGCYECIFRRLSDFGLSNVAALTRAGETVQRTVGGCAGTYSPFSALDSKRTALEAAALAIQTLAGYTMESLLLTWRGEMTPFEAEGYRLSNRARVVAPGSRIRVTGAEFGRGDCPVCGTPPASDVRSRGAA